MKKVAIGPVFNKFGGVNQHILKIKKFSSHDISIIPSSKTRKLLNIQKTISMKLFGTAKGYTIPYQEIMNIKKLRNFDVIHSQVDPWFTKLALLSKPNKWIHTYHTLYFEEDWGKLQKWQEKINKSLITIASKADVKISGSQWIHDYLYEKYSIDTIVIPNAVDIGECSKADSEQFFKKYKIKDFVLYIGDNTPIKNPKLFIELATKIPETTFVMIGSKKYDVSTPKNLIVIPQISHHDLLNALSACKVFVMTSRREGLPTVLLEAMTLGKEVVVPAHTGCKEVVHNEKYGYLYQTNDLNDLIGKTKQALDGTKGDRARERVEKYYNWKKLIKKIDKIYEE